MNLINTSVRRFGILFYTLFIVGCAQTAQKHDPFSAPPAAIKIVNQYDWQSVKIGTSRADVIALLGAAAGFDSPWDSLEYRTSESAWVIFTLFDLNNPLAQGSGESVTGVYIYDKDSGLMGGRFIAPTLWRGKTLSDIPSN